MQYYLKVFLLLCTSMINYDSLLARQCFIYSTSDSVDAIILLKKIVNDFNPHKSGTERVPTLPILTDSVRNILYKACAQSPKEAKDYLTLMLLKLYYSHLDCCNQSYMLNQGTTEIDSLAKPILYEFLRLSNINDPKLIYELYSDIAYDLVKKNCRRVRFKPILSEVKKIDLLIKERKLN